MTKDNKQYFIVGAFVITAAIILLGVWLWFATSSRQTYNTYLAVFNEPVDGLSIGAAIKYSGVEVGRVNKIKLNHDNPRNILVYLNIITSVPINKKTIATIKSIGVTGISYIELTLPPDANLNDNITPHNREPYPQIITKVSLLYSLSEQAQSVSNNIQDISGQIRQMLSDQNIKDFSQTLNNLNKTTDAIAIRSKDISNTIADLSIVVANIKNSTKDLDILTKSLIKTSNNTNKLINNFNDNTLSNINSNLLPNINQTISQINQTSYQIEQLTATLSQNPSILIKGIKDKEPGPGENK